LKNGRLAKPGIKKAYFTGKDSPGSAFLKFSIKMVNTGGYGKSALVFEFKEGMDLTGKTLVFLARSGEGTEKIDIMLTGSDGRTRSFPGVTFGPDWDTRTVELLGGKKFSLNEVHKLTVKLKRPERGGNRQESLLYLKAIDVGIK